MKDIGSDIIAKALKEYIIMYTENAIKIGIAGAENFKKANNYRERVKKAFKKIREYGSEGEKALWELVKHADDNVKVAAAFHWT